MSVLAAPHGAPVVSGRYQFTYDYAPVSDLRVTTRTNEKSGKEEVDKVYVKDEPLSPTPRFWNSLFSRFGFNKAFFKYFEYKEVFDRIAQVNGSDSMRLCVERSTDKFGQEQQMLLAVSNPTKPIVVYEEIADLIETYSGEDVRYSGGLLESMHQVPRGVADFQVAGDDFANRFLLSVPVDGYGLPNAYLALLRQVCSNGTIAYAKTFRSTLALGKGTDDVMPAMTRALEGFNNEEGFAVLRQRLEMAAKSWASVYECQTLYDNLIKAHAKNQFNGDAAVMRAGAVSIREFLGRDGQHVGNDGDVAVGSPLVAAFHKMTGDVNHLYGISNVDALSQKRQRTLPTKAKVYDLINYATEVATHYSDTVGHRAMQAWVGTLVSGEYDMEGTCDRYGDFDSFMIQSKLSTGLTGSSN